MFELLNDTEFKIKYNFLQEEKLISPGTSSENFHTNLSGECLVKEEIFCDYSLTDPKDFVIVLTENKKPELAGSGHAMKADSTTPIIADSEYCASDKFNAGGIAMSSNGFIKLNRSDILPHLIRHPHALTLLFIIATRASRVDCPLRGLKAGEAMIGDYKNYGMTRQQYRTALDFLKSNHHPPPFITIRTTNKGTVAKLYNSMVFDINLEDEQPTKPPPNNQQSHHPTTTNKNIRSKEVKKEYKKDAPNGGVAANSSALISISFSFEFKKWEGINPKDLDGWRIAYPGTNLDRELSAMSEWIIANPEKRKKNWRAFIVRWLTKAQESSGNIRQISYSKLVDRRQRNADGTPVIHELEGKF